MHVSELKQSKYLKKEDVGAGILVTIKEVCQENVAKEGAEPEYKYIVYFDGHEKGMVLNSTNGQLIAKALKSEESDDWIGHKIVLYDDPNVSFGGKLVGGIRCRAPRNHPAAPKAPAPQRPAPAARPAPAPAAAAPAPTRDDGLSDPDPALDGDVPF